MSIFEIVMLVCFGVAWPFSIHKSLTTRSSQGKSFFFLLIVLLGYVAGIIHKALYNHDRVIYLYILNLVMVTVDTALFLRNRRNDKKMECARRL